MKSRKTYQEVFEAPEALILLVDDSKMNLFVVQNLLKQTKVQIETCLSGQEALQKITEKHYDVILLDHMMPEMDGIETLKMADALEGNLCKDTPVIALTANVTSGAQEMYIRAGFHDYISKPIDGELLKRKLLKNIPQAKIVSSAPESEMDIADKKEPESVFAEPVIEAKIRKHILIVDDDVFNIKVAEDILKEYFQVSSVTSGEQALEFIVINVPDLILLDLHMPGIDGKETMNRMKASSKWKNIPIICLTADSSSETEIECLDIGAADFITKPFVPQVMLSRISRVLELDELKNNLETRLEMKTRLVEKVTLNSIMAIANTIDAKDTYTSGHSLRVAKCAEAIARKLGWKEEEIQNIHYLALLHDIGKIGVPDVILNKPARLSKEEFTLIKRHSVIGSEILKDIHTIKQVSEGALYHHERYDGTGYPFGLSGDDIPLCARIVGIADAYDAMTSNRVYRKRLSDEAVIDEFEIGRGKQFDPKLTDIFIDMLKSGFHVPHPEGEDIYVLGQSDEILSQGQQMTEFGEGPKTDSVMDMLTGFFNRGYAERRIDDMMHGSHDGALFVIELEHLKEINDIYGHIAGDRILRIFADTLMNSTSEGDVICRIEGDKFIVFFTDMTDRKLLLAKAQELLGTFTTEVKEFEFHKEASVSIGVAVFPADGADYDTVYNNAEKALYYVRRSGGNAYSFYNDEKEKGAVAVTTTTDLDNISRLIEGHDQDDAGIFSVKYDEFERLYSYISRCVKRKHQKVQTVLFTLRMNNRTENYNYMVPEEAMSTLELSIASSLRMVDVGTRYSSVQYIVILMDADEDNAGKVVERVTDRFYRTYGGKDVNLSYDIRAMQSNMLMEQVGVR